MLISTWISIIFPSEEIIKLEYDSYAYFVWAIIFHSVCNAIGLINGNFLRDFYVNKGVLITAIIFTISIVLLVATIILYRRQAENIFKK